MCGYMHAGVYIHVYILTYICRHTYKCWVEVWFYSSKGVDLWWHSQKADSQPCPVPFWYWHDRKLVIWIVECVKDWTGASFMLSMFSAAPQPCNLKLLMCILTSTLITLGETFQNTCRESFIRGKLRSLRVIQCKRVWVSLFNLISTGAFLESWQIDWS